jgi:hypothetical protein
MQISELLDLQLLQIITTDAEELDRKKEFRTIEFKRSYVRVSNVLLKYTRLCNSCATVANSGLSVNLTDLS